MIDPKETAIELVNKFAIIQLTKGHISYEVAKQCALIHVNELVELLNHDLGHDFTAHGLKQEYNQVKTEIELL